MRHDSIKAQEKVIVYGTPKSKTLRSGVAYEVTKLQAEKLVAQGVATYKKAKEEK